MPNPNDYGHCQMCPKIRPLRNDGAVPKHSGAHSYMCPGSEHLPLPATDVLEPAFNQAVAAIDSEPILGFHDEKEERSPVYHLGMLMQRARIYGKPADVVGEQEQALKALEHLTQTLGVIFFFSDSWRKYSRCRICSVTLSTPVYRKAGRMLSRICCSAECYQRARVLKYACCDQAIATSCVCLYSFSCPVHGQKHVGDHT